MEKQVSWVAVDWGTSRLRVWGMDEGGQACLEASSGSGMGTLSPSGFEPALLALIGDWLPPDRRTLVLACGMVGARQGWSEAPYVSVPTSPQVPTLFHQVEPEDPRIDVRIVPGLRQDDPADVMRGEETQVSGLLSFRPAFSGVICMPGTHTKWVTIESSQIVRFRSTMSGELFALLEDHSVLRHSLQTDMFCEEAFTAAVTERCGLAQLFSIRAGDLLHDVPADVSRGRLSGLLIGAEVEAMRQEWFGREIILLGSAELSRLYKIALETAGTSPETVDGTALTLKGLVAAKRAISKVELP